LYFNHEKNFSQAVKYFKLAAANGKSARAMNNLGICFETGPQEFKATGEGERVD